MTAADPKTPAQMALENAAPKPSSSQSIAVTIAVLVDGQLRRIHPAFGAAWLVTMPMLTAGTLLGLTFLLRDSPFLRGVGWVLALSTIGALRFRRHKNERSSVAKDQSDD